jgi:putative flippase GtrA
VKASGKPVFFILVGAAAVLVHLGTVYLLVSSFALSPLVANVIGFACAFVVSFSGHRRYTFSANARLTRSLARWLQVSATAFIANQILYMAALRYLPQIGYLLSLVVVTGIIATASYVMGKMWAFSS